MDGNGDDKLISIVACMCAVQRKIKKQKTNQK